MTVKPGLYPGFYFYIRFRMVSIFSYFLVLLLGFLGWESCFAQGVDNFDLFLVVVVAFSLLV